MNNKTAPNQMRILIKRMRTGDAKYGITETQEKKKKEMTVRDMLKITRHLDEQVEDTQPENPEGENKAVNKETAFDQKREEQKLVDFFGGDVNFEFKKLEVYDNWVLWSGIVNSVIQFLFVVTPDEVTSRVEFNYLQGFSPDNPNNDEILEKLQTYYETTFSKYWRNNLIQQ